jgi:hypothetical protein
MTDSQSIENHQKQTSTLVYGAFAHRDVMLVEVIVLARRAHMVTL